MYACIHLRPEQLLIARLFYTIEVTNLGILFMAVMTIVQCL